MAEKFFTYGEEIEDEEAETIPIRKPGMVAISTGYNPFWAHVDEEIIDLAIKISRHPKAWTKAKQEETALCMTGGWGYQNYERALMKHGLQRYKDLQYAAKAYKALVKDGS